MSAKDIRKSLIVRVPDALMPVVRRQRRAGRSASGAAALRVIVRAHLDRADVAATPRAPTDGRAYRLQLDRNSRQQIEARAHAHGCSAEAIVLGILQRASQT